MHDDRAAPIMSWVPATDRFSSFHVVRPDGRAYSRGAAVIATLATTSRTRYFGRILAALRLTKLVDVGYWIVATRRDFLGRFVKDAPGPERWRL
jgi:predicted DCC family thiol-disulfide oxidoreductase YuxK